MVRRLYGDSLASGQQEKDNDQRTEKGLPVRRQLPLQSVHVQRRLQFIRHAQAAGFTLEEIKELLDLDSTDDRQRARELATARVKALDDQIRKLKSARDALKTLARECAGGEGGPCPILSAFDA
jgi:cell division protein FtsB